MRKYDPSSSRLYYINQDGSRCVRIDANNNRETLPVSFDGITIKQVSVKYWEQLGNFAFPNVRNKGKIVTVYPDSDTEPTKWVSYDVKYPKSN